MNHAKLNMPALAGVLVAPAVAAGVGLIYVCHSLVTGAAVVLDIFSRSLN